MRALFAILCIFVSMTAYADLDSEEGDELKRFERWQRKSTLKLESQSQIAQTSSGPIEFVKYGTGPVVVCLHGSPGGFDQSFLIGSNLVLEGYTVIGISRPGYLRTPLSVGQTYAEQADAVVGLLDALGIQKAAILGYSSGAFVAFEFAARHPDRIWALVLESLVQAPGETALYRFVLEHLMYTQLSDFGSWLLHRSVRSQSDVTEKLILSCDNLLAKPDLERRIKFVLSHEHQRKFLSHLIYSMIPLSPRSVGLVNDLNNLDQWHSFNYSQIKTPSIIIQSKADENGFYEEAVSIASQISGSTLISLEGTGHFIWLGSHTREWERKLVEFLQKSSL
jgi:pimeloyl-ACP methyl ester carboxylesterase